MLVFRFDPPPARRDLAWRQATRLELCHYGSLSLEFFSALGRESVGVWREGIQLRLLGRSRRSSRK